MLPNNLELLSRPATYLTFSFAAKDSKKHDLVIYFDAGAEIAVNNPNQTVSKSTIEFEKQFTEQLSGAGGEDYVKLCALAYRQVLGANKLVAGKDGVPLMFSKENFSNGCIATVDIMYPMSPFFLYYSPELMRATLEPEFQYAESERCRRVLDADVKTVKFRRNKFLR